MTTELCLALFIYAHALHEPPITQYAVASAARNRATDVCSILTWEKEVAYQTVEDWSAWVSARSLAEVVLTHNLPDITKGAVAFARTRDARGGERIGTFVFYQDIKP